MAFVWVGRFNRFVEKLFNVKGGPTLVDVDPSIQTTLAITVGVEERYLIGVELFAAAALQIGVAANKSAAMIRNPAGSNVIVAIEKITPQIAASGHVVLAVAGSNPADLANPVANHTRSDPRGRSLGSCIVTADAPAVDPITGFLTIADIVLGTTSQDLIVTHNSEIVLLPGIALRVIEQTVNQGLTCTFFWRERPLESSELT